MKAKYPPNIALTYPHPAGTIPLYDFTDDSEDGHGA